MTRNSKEHCLTYIEGLRKYLINLILTMFMVYRDIFVIGNSQNRPQSQLPMTGLYFGVLTKRRVQSRSQIVSKSHALYVLEVNLRNPVLKTTRYLV